MILQALYGYYERLREHGSVPSLGFAFKNVGFALVLTPKGDLVDIVDLRSADGSKTIPKKMIIPFCNEVGARASNIQPNFLVDKAGYILGVDLKTKAKRLEEMHVAYKQLVEKVAEGVHDPALYAVLAFLSRWDPSQIPSFIKLDEVAADGSGWLTFQIDGDLEYIHERSAVQHAWTRYFLSPKTDSSEGFCLISGKNAVIQRLHAQFTGIPGAQSSGALLVSFNDESHQSFNKKQGANAPSSLEAEFRASTALKFLMSKESSQKVLIGDSNNTVFLTIFWAERDSPAEELFGIALDPRVASGDDQRIRLFLQALRDGKMPMDLDAEMDPDVRFFILGLSPNKSRLSVRFWQSGTVGNIYEKIGQHFRDLSIERTGERDPEFPSVALLTLETAPLRKRNKMQLRDFKDVPSHLSGAFARAILQGTPYPKSLLAQVIMRIRADQEINYLRASLIKAYLARVHRIHKKDMEVGMTLNTSSTNAGYRLGRLFAALEKAQSDAVPGANSTIKDRFYGSASATPRVVFPQLLRLAQHHIAKSDYGRATDKKIEEILSGIDAFPAHLSLEDQGFFALGYYHQRNSFFPRKDKEDN